MTHKYDPPEGGWDRDCNFNKNPGLKQGGHDFPRVQRFDYNRLAVMICSGESLTSPGDVVTRDVFWYNERAYGV